MNHTNWKEIVIICCNSIVSNEMITGTRLHIQKTHLYQTRFIRIHVFIEVKVRMTVLMYLHLLIQLIPVCILYITGMCVMYLYVGVWPICCPVKVVVLIDAARNTLSCYTVMNSDVSVRVRNYLFSHTSDFPPCWQLLWDKSISHGFHDLQLCALINVL